MNLLAFRTYRRLLRFLRLDRERKWNRQHRTGRWDYLGGLDEIARYSILAGYLLRLKPGARVLDVGCGEALLLDHLHPRSWSSYLGVDYREAVQKAQPRARPNVRFAIGDMIDFETAERFDAIVFNESLYYLPDLPRGLRRYETMLDSGGIFLVSMVDNANNAARWLEIDPGYQVLDAVGIRNHRGITWTVKAFAPLPNG